jgi:hypothetical protein
VQKLLENWEDQYERSFFHKAYIIKEHDIPAELFVNSDQTQLMYAPDDKMTWADTGAKQVSLINTDEKHAFMVMVLVVSNRTLLPFQAIYQGKTAHLCPAPSSPHYQDVLDVGFQLIFSEMYTYWSNQQTMKLFVNNILAPYYDRKKADLGYPLSQKSLWQIDVWSVHCSDEFCKWMKGNHPFIIVDFVPGGCTGVHQPCDVGIQHPFKSLTKQSYHEDIVKEMLAQLNKDPENLMIDNHILVLQN